MMQLDIFSLPRTNTSGELPSAVLPTKTEEAIAQFAELKKLSINDDLVVGCHVRSDLFFKGKIGKVIALNQVHTFTMATVHINFDGYSVEFPCAASKLEVIS